MFVIHADFFRVLKWAFVAAAALAVMHDAFGWWL